MKPLGQKIRDARKIKGLTQTQLAQQLGVTQGAVRQWEAGATSPSAGKLAKVASLLDLPVVELLSDTHTPQIAAGRDATVALGHGATATNGGDLSAQLVEVRAELDALRSDLADIKSLLIKLAAK